MAYKNREPSKELKILSLLNARMDLPFQDKQHYNNLKKGYEGEIQFDRLIEGAKLDKKFYVLNDLLLQYEKTDFQIDSAIITQNTLIPCEVKNYYGNYYYHDKNFICCTTNEPINNPLEQINRKKIYLQKLLKKYRFFLTLDSNLVFIHPEFYLYQAPLNEPIVYYTQLNQFLRNLNAMPSYLNESHHSLANFLVQQHKTDSPYTKLPPYNYASIRKGNICGCCSCFRLIVRDKIFVCLQCGYEESIENGVLRIVEEIRLLFPELNITLNIVDEWCQSLIPKWSIRRILKKHFKIVGYGQWACYE
jgi:hypothetical protein